MIIITTATTLPTILAENRVNKTAFQPRKAPTSPINLTSPSPMASRGTTALVMRPAMC